MEIRGPSRSKKYNFWLIPGQLLIIPVKKKVECNH